MDDLKPCPFCGTHAHIEKVKVRFSKNHVCSRRNKRTGLFYTIGCCDPTCILHSDKRSSKLFFTASPDGVETMIRRWNRRINE